MKKCRFLSVLLTIAMLISMLPWVTLTARADDSNDASLTSVLEQDIHPGSEAGDNVNPKTASINVVSSVAVLAVGDVAAASNTTVNLYSDSGFSTEVTGGDTISLTSGDDTTVYIKVTAQDNTTVQYYAITIHRAAVTSSISLVVSPNVEFTAATAGYGEQAPHSVRVDNTGANATGTLNIALSGTGANGFTLSKIGISDIAVSGSDSFQVTPATGLAPGTYSATVTVSGDNVEAKSFHVSFTVSPAEAVFDVTIRTYMDGSLADVTGDVELVKGTLVTPIPNDGKGIYTTTIANGNYFVYVNGVSTDRTIAINNAANSLSLEYYTVNFSGTFAETATGCSVNATAGNHVIASGTMVLKGTPVAITASGKGAGSYTYAWTGTHGATTATLSIGSLSGTVNAACTVTGIGTPPIDPDYKINNDAYSWTSENQNVVLAGANDTFTILKAPSHTIKIDIQSVDDSVVTIEGNSVACTNTYVVVSNDITLNLDSINIAAPDNIPAIKLLKNDTDSKKATLNIINTCSLKGGARFSGIHSTTDQDLTITGTGTLNTMGGDSPDTSSGGHGIYMEAYSTPTKVGAGAKLTITGGVIINATGGNAPNSAGGGGVSLAWGDMVVNGATLTALNGTSGSNSSGSAISVSFPAYDKTQGGKLTIINSEVTATAGSNTSMVGGRGVYADTSINISGSTVTVTGGSSSGNNGGVAIFANQKNIVISDSTVDAKGGNGNSYGAHAVYSGLGTITVHNSSNLTAIGGDGATSGGVGLRAPGYDGTNTYGNTVTIANDAGNVYVRGGKSTTTQRASVMGKDVYIGTGNIGAVVMEGSNSRSIKNTSGGDNVYLVNVSTVPAGAVEIRCAVSGGTAPSYTYHAIAASDGTACLWLPAGAQILSATGYTNADIDVVANDTENVVTLAKASTVTAHDSTELETYLASSHITEINLVAGQTYTYNGGAIQRAVTIDGKGATLHVGTGIDGTVIKMTSGAVPNATGKVFLEVQGTSGNLTLKNITIQNEEALLLCGINVKAGGSLTLEGVKFKGFYGNPVSGGTVNNFGVHAEPEAVSTIIKNCAFDASNAIRNAVAIRGGTASITDSTFMGTANPERLNNSDGYEYGIYLYGGTATITGNTMSGYDGKLIPGYLSSPIATAPYYDITAAISGNTLTNSTVGLNLVGAWHTLSSPCMATVNGVSLSSSNNAFTLGEALAGANTISNNTNGGIQLNLDQNDFYTDNTSTSVPKEEFGTPAYFGGLLSLSEKTSSSATVAFSSCETAKAAIANQKSFVIQVSDNNGATWTNATTSTALNANSTGATVSLTSGKTYLLRAVLTITSKTRPAGSIDDVSADIVCYSNTVSAQIKSSGGGSSTTGTAATGTTSPATGGATVIVNGESKTAGTAKTINEADGKTATTVTVDSNKLQTILAAEGSGATVVVPVTGKADIAKGNLTGDMVKDMENKSATLVMKTDTATYTLPAAEINIDSVSQQLGADISLKDISVTVSIAEPSKQMTAVVENAAKDGGFTLVAPAVDYTVTCDYGNKTVSVKKFNAYVERTIAIPHGVDPTKITTGVVVETDGTVHHVPTRITVTDGKYYAVINSLTNSTYSIVWNPIEFSDVANHWAKNSVNNMGSRMVVSGIGNGQYEPDRNMTRGEFAAIMVRALGLEPSDGASSFSDVDSSKWYCGYIVTAASYGVIKGYPDGRFGPNDTITREQAMAIIARAMETTGLKANVTEDTIAKQIENYEDGTTVSEYAKKGVADCLDTGVVSGLSSNMLAPKANVTRAQVAAMVERLLQKSNLI